MSGSSRLSAVERITEVAARSADLVTLWSSATEILSATFPHFWDACWYTLDPASLLITSHVHQGKADLPDRFPEELLAHEYYGDDVNKLTDVSRSESGVATLHEATGGNPERSLRWRQGMKVGSDQELRVSLRTKGGEVWGALGLYRQPGAPAFDGQDMAALRAAAPRLAEGARQALLIGEAATPEGADSPGLVVLTPALEVDSTSPGVELRLRELPDGDWDAGRLPSAVLSVAARALRIAEEPANPEKAVARVLSRSGSWIVLHGACLTSKRHDRRVAVVVEAAQPARIYPLLMSVYGLTARERDITRLILRGHSTAQIATELMVSTHTVQQHLKHIFDKTSVRSRRDLVGKVFLAHYQPLFRDNEVNASRGRPVRGGPPTTSAPDWFGRHRDSDVVDHA